LKGGSVEAACPITGFDLVDVAAETTRSGWLPTDRNVIINKAVSFNGKSYGIIWKHEVNKPFLIAPQVEMYDIICKNPKRYPKAVPLGTSYPLIAVHKPGGCGVFGKDTSYSVKADE